MQDIDKTVVNREKIDLVTAAYNPITSHQAAAGFTLEMTYLLTLPNRTLILN